MALRSPLLIAIVASVWAAPVWAQSFNIDIGTGTATPSATYGAAANQPGVWNVHAGNDMTPFALVDLGGQPTAVTLQMPLPFGSAAFDYPGTNGGNEDLLDDYFDLHSTPATFAIVGLRPGEYGVYTYAWAPDDALFRTTVQVNGLNPVMIGGGWPNRLEEGTVYAHHWVSVTSTGGIEIYTYGRPRGTLNGIQIVEGEDPPPRDGGVTDAEEDAGFEEDAALTDSGPNDLGSDTGVDAADVGQRDTGVDAGRADSGASVDAGAVGDPVVEEDCSCRSTRSSASGLWAIAGLAFLVRRRATSS